MLQRILLIFMAVMLAGVSGKRHIQSTSLLTCMDNSQFTASHFEVTFYPDLNKVYFDISAISSIDAKTGALIEVSAYGINIISQNVSFCSLGYKEICPFTSGHLELNSHYEVPDSLVGSIPGVAYSIPDLDARVQVILYNTDTYEQYACVVAILTNGKTVQTKYAAWPIAAVSGLGLLTSGVISVIGHSNTAAHIAANSMSLFVYFQSLAITSMMAVSYVPPIAAAWAQNFQWSLGIIKVGFIQDIANWYVQATGGEVTDIMLPDYLSISVQKKIKRSTTEFLNGLYRVQQKANQLMLFKRASLENDNFGFGVDSDTSYTTDEKADDLSSKILILRGIQRVSYLAGIEITSLFMTSIIFLLFFTFLLVVFISAFKAIIEILIRAKWMKEGKFAQYRQEWSHIMKGSLYRLMLFSLPTLSLMCLWEFTEDDSAGCIVVAIFLLCIVLVLLFQAGVRVFLLGRRSTRQYKNAAYLLYGDSKFLSKFGFVYVFFRADRYYFVLITLIYVVLKSLFVAVLQGEGKAQSVIVFAIELVYCILVCWLRPYMDKRTNAFNICIGVISTINALFFMFFSYIFRQPHVVSSIMAVVYFFLNAAFSLFLLLFTIITCILALVYKNPDTRYHPMKDDRVSFMPRFDRSKNTGENIEPVEDDMELIALGETAMKGHENNPSQLYEDESVYDEELERNRQKFDQNVYQDSDSDKRDSYYLESFEPTQPSSTLVGNPSNTGNYHTAYGSSSNINNHGSNGKGGNGQRDNFI